MINSVSNKDGFYILGVDLVSIFVTVNAIYVDCRLLYVKFLTLTMHISPNIAQNNSGVDCLLKVFQTFFKYLHDIVDKCQYIFPSYLISVFDKPIGANVTLPLFAIPKLELFSRTIYSRSLIVLSSVLIMRIRITPACAKFACS